MARLDSYFVDTINATNYTTTATSMVLTSNTISLDAPLVYMSGTLQSVVSATVFIPGGTQTTTSNTIEMNANSLLYSSSYFETYPVGVGTLTYQVQSVLTANTLNMYYEDPYESYDVLLINTNQGLFNCGIQANFIGGAVAIELDIVDDPLNITRTYAAINGFEMNLTIPIYTTEYIQPSSGKGVLTFPNTVGNTTLNIATSGLLGYSGVMNISADCANTIGVNSSTSASLVMVSALTFATTTMSAYKYVSPTTTIKNAAEIVVTASTTTTNISMTASKINVNGDLIPSAGIFTTGVTILNFTGGVSALTIQSSNYLVIAELTDPIVAATINLPSNPKNGETHVIKGLHFPGGGGTATVNIATTAANAFEDNKTASPYSMVVSSTDANLRSVTMVYVASKTSWFVTAGYQN